MTPNQSLSNTKHQPHPAPLYLHVFNLYKKTSYKGRCYKSINTKIWSLDLIIVQSGALSELRFLLSFPPFCPPGWTSEWHFFENVLCSLCRSFNSHSLMWRLETWETLISAVSCLLIQPCILPLVTGLFGLRAARILDISSLFLSCTFSFLSISFPFAWTTFLKGSQNTVNHFSAI